MKKIIYAAAMLGIFACNNGSTTTPDGQTATTDTTNAAQGAIPSIALTGNKNTDILGTFKAEYPCSDCKVNAVLLTVTNSGNAMYRERKIGKKDDKGVSLEGKWAFNADSTAITITPKEGSKGEARTFKYEAGTLIQLTSAGTPIDCGTSDCTLKKIQPVKVSTSTASGAPTTEPNGKAANPGGGKIEPTPEMKKKMEEAKANGQTKVKAAKTPMKADPSTNK